MAHLIHDLASWFKLDEIDIDNWMFKLYYRASALLCMTGATVGIATQYFGDPIRCVQCSLLSSWSSFSIAVVSSRVSILTWRRTSVGYTGRPTYLRSTNRTWSVLWSWRGWRVRMMLRTLPTISGSPSSWPSRFRDFVLYHLTAFSISYFRLEPSMLPTTSGLSWRVDWCNHSGLTASPPWWLPRIWSMTMVWSWRLSWRSLSNISSQYCITTRGTLGTLCYVSTLLLDSNQSTHKYLRWNAEFPELGVSILPGGHFPEQQVPMVWLGGEFWLLNG